MKWVGELVSGRIGMSELGSGMSELVRSGMTSELGSGMTELGKWGLGSAMMNWEVRCVNWAVG